MKNRFIIVFLVAISILSKDVFANKNDLLFHHQWNMHANGQIIQRDLNDLHSEFVTANGKTNWGFKWFQKNKDHLIDKNIVVAVLDGGVDSEHPDLEGHVLKGWNFATDDGKGSDDTFDHTGHGTHVAGLIAAKQNRIGIRGFGDFIKILPITVFHKNEKKYKKSPLSKRIAQGIRYAKSKGVDIINLSLGWPKVMHTKDLQFVIEEAIKQDIIIVAAAGNSSNQAKIYPCIIKGVVCVGSIDPEGKASRFSNYGHAVDVVAPGEMIVSTYPTHLTPLKFSISGYEKMSGTSQAAPLISGMLAMIKSSLPDATAEEIKHRLFASANKTSPDSQSLFGLPQVKEAILGSTKKVYMNLKHLSSIVLDNESKFNLNLSFSMFNLNSIDIEIKSSELSLKRNRFEVKNNEKISLEGFYKGVKTSTTITIYIKETGQSFVINLDILKKLKETSSTFLIKSKKRQSLLIKNNTRLISKLKSVPSLVNKIPKHLFYFYNQKANQISIYKELTDGIEEAENIKIKSECKLLRFYHINIDSPSKDNYLIESYCTDSNKNQYLSYSFLDSNFSLIQEDTKFIPEVTLINFKNVFFKTIDSKIHIYYLENGKVPEFSRNTDPWASIDTERKMRIYHLVPEGNEYLTSTMNNFEFNEENSLGNYKILYANFLPKKINIIIAQGKESWNQSLKALDISYSNEIQSKQTIPFKGFINNQSLKLIDNHLVFENFYTPYQAKVNYFDLRKQKISSVIPKKVQFTNPMYGTLGHIVSKDHRTAVMRSYQAIHFISHSNDNIIEETQIPYQRLDFIGMKNLQEEVSFISKPTNTEHLAQIVIDGTNISLDIVKVISFTKNLKTIEQKFQVPKNCAQVGLTQNIDISINFLCAKKSQLVLIKKVL